MPGGVGGRTAGHNSRLPPHFPRLLRWTMAPDEGRQCVMPALQTPARCRRRLVRSPACAVSRSSTAFGGSVRRGYQSSAGDCRRKATERRRTASRGDTHGRLLPAQHAPAASKNAAACAGAGEREGEGGWKATGGGARGHGTRSSGVCASRNSARESWGAGVCGRRGHGGHGVGPFDTKGPRTDGRAEPGLVRASPAVRAHSEGCAFLRLWMPIDRRTVDEEVVLRNCFSSTWALLTRTSP